MYSGFTSLGSLSHFECCWLLPLYDTFFPWAPWPHFCKLLFFFPLPLRVLLHLCQIVCLWPAVRQGSPGGSVVKNPPTNAGDVGVIPGLGRSLGEGNGNPLQYSCLGNPMDRGAWRLWSIGWQRGGYDWNDQASTHACAHTHTHTHTIKASNPLWMLFCLLATALFLFSLRHNQFISNSLSFFGLQPSGFRTTEIALGQIAK